MRSLRQSFGIARWMFVGAACVSLGACNGAIGLAPPGTSTSGDMTVVDAAVVVPADAAAPDATVDRGVPDLALLDSSVIDASMLDLAVPDLTALADATMLSDRTILVDQTIAGDLAGPCKGGYVNAVDAATTCPLQCGPQVESVADEGATHEAYNTPVHYAHNPPASGNHWPSPAPWGYWPRNYIPREWWVHNLEHGGVVLLYNCPYSTDGGVMAPGDGGTWTLPGADGGGQPLPDNCKSEIAKLVQIYSSHPVDNFWDAYFEVRMVVTADPLLPTRFAAVAWDWVWSSNTLGQQDLMNLQCFIDARYGYGPEWAP